MTLGAGCTTWSASWSWQAITNASPPAPTPSLTVTFDDPGSTAFNATIVPTFAPGPPTYPPGSFQMVAASLPGGAIPAGATTATLLFSAPVGTSLAFDSVQVMVS